jgi:hypothetical protein
MRVEHCCNDDWQGKPEVLGKTLPQYYFVRNKFDIEFSGIKPDSRH